MLVLCFYFLFLLSWINFTENMQPRTGDSPHWFWFHVAGNYIFSFFGLSLHAFGLQGVLAASGGLLLR